MIVYIQHKSTIIVELSPMNTAGIRYTQGIPQYLYTPRSFTVRYVPLPAKGTVSAGTGTVYQICTRGIPLMNPRWICLGRILSVVAFVPISFPPLTFLLFCIHLGLIEIFLSPHVS